MSARVRPPFEEPRIGLTLAEPVLITLTTPERFMAAVRRRWWVLALAVMVGGACGIVAGRMLTPWYQSTAGFAVIPLDDPTVPNNDSTGAALPLFSQILTSRRVADEVVARLELTRAYGLKTPQQARGELLSHVTVNQDRRANIVLLSVEDRVPVRAKMIADAIGEVSRAVNAEIWSARPVEHRKQLEARLAEVAAALNAAEEKMRAFREREHVVDLTEQVKASVGEAAFLERIKNNKKVQLNFDQKFAAADAPEVQRGQLEAGGAQAVLQGLVHGDTQRGTLLALDKFPRLEQEHARLKRDIDTNNATYEFLAHQVEQLRAVEARPGGRAELVDAPSDPTAPVRPSRFSLMVEGCFVGLLLGLLLVVWPRARFTEVRAKSQGLRAESVR